MIVGGYSLHLYCDGPFHAELHPVRLTSLDAEFEGHDERDCNRQAKRRGWHLRKGIAICPDCYAVTRTQTVKG